MFYDVIIIGGGAAGLMCAIQAGYRKRKVLLIDHAKKLGGKILISGGGRCNFTNKGATPKNYVSHNPHFFKSALSRYTPYDFIELVKKYNISFYEKKWGQLFCTHSARPLLNMLLSEAHKANVENLLDCKIKKISVIRHCEESKTTRQSHRDSDEITTGSFRTLVMTAKDDNEKFEIETTQKKLSCSSLVIATGGLSIPKLGASGFGYNLAKQFGLSIVQTYPALDGFILNPQEINFFGKLAGISLDCMLTCNGEKFRENILFTHKGLSGPAALQASLYWNEGDSIFINLLPELNGYEWLLQRKNQGERFKIKNILKEKLPHHFVDHFCLKYFQSEKSLNEIKNQDLKNLSKIIHAWEIKPLSTVGYHKAEVTRGGVDTHELSSKTLESTKVKGLYFIGEVVDVTGQLGGYNFQWAWASGWAAGQVV
ncbi:MAG: NAD(P)/FAD-dependent oxidoreductase [Deltaproteobacteria bacterium]|nr:NAD(P)/FAD-dependent oxidoreductase [Deltaproteobacteria bacterium]